MNAVTFLLLYAAALTWLAPVLLISPVWQDVKPRLSVAGWLTAVGSALCAWLGALAILVIGASRSLLTHTAPTFCVETLGITRVLASPPPVATVLVAVLLTLTAAVAVYTARRLVRALLSTRRQNRHHVESVRIVGRPSEYDGVVAVTAAEPTAYCVAGGGKTAVVVTTGALELLDPRQLAAVLAHERAHLRGRHHLIVATLHALAAALPRLPLMVYAARTVPTLLEMCADDVATRHHSRDALLTSIVALSTRQPREGTVLAAAGTAVLDRAIRLAQPPPQFRWQPRGLVLRAIMMATIGLLPVALTLCTL
ncbi:M56 family metallopeptidase [Mycobacterium sp. 141]|uniref:M56 family metallopeptidase n=1 Tax=Mycobacterium sp. 141 TaxID=1120797 RepID=UPI000367E320|nr:M56 family metallopeptidase [Mycobacterium sp. 141]